MERDAHPAVPGGVSLTLADLLGVHFRLREALALGFLISLAATLIIMPRAMHRLRGARITGKDRHKPGRPEIPEMGGLVVFLAFNSGAFTILAFGDLAREGQLLALASLVTIVGAALTGALDDLISLQQRFKAFIPLAFAAPLALYVEDTTVAFPFLGTVDFGLFYPLLFVPLGIAFGSNAFNMLEGFNGLGTGLGILTASTLALLALLSGNYLGLPIVVPLIGALVGFWVFNSYPARVFPGDTGTLMIGGTLATVAILSKLEIWVAILFLPQFVEFFLKARGRFKIQSFADRMENGRMYRDGGVYSLTHVPMKIWPGLTEPRLVLALHAGQLLLAAACIGGFLLMR